MTRPPKKKGIGQLTQDLESKVEVASDIKKKVKAVEDSLDNSKKAADKKPVEDIKPVEPNTSASKKLK